MIPNTPPTEQEPQEVQKVETEGEGKWITIKLKNGVVLQVMPIISAVIFVGYDPSNGLPVYQIGMGSNIRIQEVPKGLIKKVSSTQHPKGYQ